jgi:hypothetical protein
MSINVVISEVDAVVYVVLNKVEKHAFWGIEKTNKHTVSLIKYRICA